jgi:small subunit ribosomal protein S13
MVEENKKQTFKHIVRIANVDLPGEKVLRIAMRKIKGIGINFADAICAVSGVNKQAKTGDLSDEDVKKLNETVSTINTSNIPKRMLNRQKDYETGEDVHILTGNLSFIKDNDLKRLKKIKSYRGMRHQKGLPVRGQRTRANFRKSKGKVIGVKKKVNVKAGK